MPTLREIETYLAGLWLLVKTDPQGFSYLDLSDRGMLRSFWSFVWCIPAMVISWLWLQGTQMANVPAEAKTGTIFFIRMAMIEAANWIVPLVLAGVMMGVLGVGQKFRAVVVTINWLNLPFSYIYSVLIITVFFLPGLQGLVALLWLVLLMAFIVTMSRVLRMIFGPQPLLIATLILVLMVPTIVLSEILKHFLGL